MNWRMLGVSVLCVALLALVLGACGGDDAGDDEGAPSDPGRAMSDGPGDGARAAESQAEAPVGDAAAAPDDGVGAEQPESTGGLETPEPDPRPEDTTFFQNYGVNPQVNTADDNLSTFAMDVDTASYTQARSSLLSYNALPNPDSIRSEEFINFFDAGYEPPTDGDTFTIHLEAAPAPFGEPGSYLLRVGLQGRYIAPEDRTPALLIFVIDVSGSMDQGNRLGLVKDALEILLGELREDDRVGIVVYSSTPYVVLEPTPASEFDTIMNAINALGPGGSTALAGGLELGYRMAQEHKRAGQITRVVVCSDGVGNVGPSGPEPIIEMISGAVDDGITLSTIGFGMGNYNDTMMEQLADNGNGNYYYIDDLREARRVFVHNLTGTLQVIAYDAKVQVEFNPEVTSAYRLIGYENRDIADEQFRDDTVDAGEVGAGHSITALYEIVLHDDASSGVVATAYIRYQDAESGEVVETSQDITVDDLLPDFSDTSPGFRLHAAVAELSELLRNSYWAQGGSYQATLAFAQPLESAFPGSPDITDLLEMIRAAGRLVDQ
ncbi:MAG: DUF3520 domain-containing protein [Chloroflexi bacterium]|nr:DUF3520 domain-containing protein [Chloroflexota bacterium]